MKQELRQLKQVWWRTRNKAIRTPYRLFMKTFEVAVKVTKRDFFVASIATASSFPGQLFRITRLLSSLKRREQKVGDLALSCEAESCRAP